ncbi:MAG: hypothetical protein ACLFP4_09055 [Spirochaetales bacterium]
MFESGDDSAPGRPNLEAVANVAAQGRSREARRGAELRLSEAHRRFELGLLGADVLENREQMILDLEFEEELVAYDVELFVLAARAVGGVAE